MFYVEDVFSLSQKIEHTENGDSAFMLSLSTTPAATGKVYMNFGPLSQSI